MVDKTSLMLSGCNSNIRDIIAKYKDITCGVESLVQIPLKEKILCIPIKAMRNYY